MNKPPLPRSRTEQEKAREELLNKKVTAFITRCMKKNNISFIQLQKALKKNGVDITITNLRKKVQKGKCKATFVFEILDALNLEIEASDRKK